MTDQDHVVIHEEPLTDTLRRYLQRRRQQDNEEMAARIDTGLASIRQNLPGLQDKELARRISALERKLNAHLDRHASQEKYLAKLNRYKKTRDRDEQGRLQDQLLIDLERRRVLLKLTQRQLAEILFVDLRSLSKWLTRKVSPQMAATRQKMEGWLKETEAEAVLLDKRLADELAEWM
jgi:DNA-binding transcriptional regulator YiaG